MPSRCRKSPNAGLPTYRASSSSLRSPPALRTREIEAGSSPLRPSWTSSHMIESEFAAGVLIANVNECGRFPAVVLIASQVRRSTTPSSSTIARLGSKPCREPGSAGGVRSTESVAGT